MKHSNDWLRHRHLLHCPLKWHETHPIHDKTKSLEKPYACSWSGEVTSLRIFYFFFLMPAWSCFSSFQERKRWNRRVNTLNSTGRISASVLLLWVAWGCCGMACEDRQRYVQQDKAQLVGEVLSQTFTIQQDMGCLQCGLKLWDRAQ